VQMLTLGEGEGVGEVGGGRGEAGEERWGEEGAVRGSSCWRRWEAATRARERRDESSELTWNICRGKRTEGRVRRVWGQ